SSLHSVCFHSADSSAFFLFLGSRHSTESPYHILPAIHSIFTPYSYCNSCAAGHSIT
ncbi:hypothetical protein EV363DRAFT_1224126, partial [Boletus edulis]